MNETELTALRAQIENRLAEISQSDALGKDGQAVVALDQQSVGRLSRMDALQNQAMAKAQQSRRSGEAQRLQTALVRMETGDYGVCDDCGEEIAIGRLRLDPAAMLCISCARGG